MFASDNSATQGVLYGYNNGLAVTGTSSPVSIATGAAIVNGWFYENDSSLTQAITTPTLGTTGHRIVLRASTSAQTVRIALLSSSNGVSAIPALTQTASTWEISLATIQITTGGVITVTDDRSYCYYPTRVALDQIDFNAPITLTSASYPVLNIVSSNPDAALFLTSQDTGGHQWRLTSGGGITPYGQGSFAIVDNSASFQPARFIIDANGVVKDGNSKPFAKIDARQGGDATNWSTSGTTTYVPTSVVTQVGSIAGSSGTSGNISVTYPIAFANKPLLFPSFTNVDGVGVSYNFLLSSATGFTLRWTTGLSSTPILNWMAIGV